MHTNPANKGPYHDAFIEMKCLRHSEEVSQRYVPTTPPNANAYEQVGRLVNILNNRANWLPTAIHPTVEEALKKFGKPKDWHLLTLEQPQLASDGVRVAYVRNEAKREAHFAEHTNNKHLTATTAGKYLTRHWPHISSSEIRNLVEMGEFDFEIIETMDGMLDAIRTCTATSCMTGSLSVARHPYEVYDPKYGWKMAVVKCRGDGSLIGRALLLDDGKHKVFVRTYGREANGYTQSHPGLQGWLEDKGYSFESEWPEGCKFSKIETGCTHLAPYLDPGADRADDNARRVSDGGDHMYRDDEGEYIWNNTNGRPDDYEDEDTAICEDCDDLVHEDDICWVGRYSDRGVCECCRDNEYTYAYGRNGELYYAYNNNVVEVNGEYYDDRYLDDNKIVQLHDGEYCPNDDAVYIESCREYYRCDDIAGKPDDSGDIVEVYDEYILRDDAQWCIYNEEWISDGDATEVADGEYVKATDFMDYIFSLDRDAVEDNCIEGDDSEDVLAAWDKHHASGKHQAVLELAA